MELQFSHFFVQQLQMMGHIVFQMRGQILTRRPMGNVKPSSRNGITVVENHSKSLIFYDVCAAAKLTVFEFSRLCSCFDLPKFTHSTAELYQNSPLLTKHGQFSSFLSSQCCRTGLFLAIFKHCESLYLFKVKITLECNPLEHRDKPRGYEDR